MVTRRDVLELVEAGVGYEEAGRRLRIHPGLAYMIATGLPADGSDALRAEDRERPGFVATTTQPLANPAPVHNPTHRDAVQYWIDARVRADAQMQQAHAQHPPTPPTLGDTGDDDDIAAVIARDHHALHKLVTQLQTTPTRKQGATAKQIARRGAIVAALRDSLERHEHAEQEHLWPFVRTALSDGAALADRARDQEQQAHDTLQNLATAETGSDDFEQLVEQLQHQIRSHAAFEDRVLMALRDATDTDQRVGAGRGLSRAERSSNGAA